MWGTSAYMAPEQRTHGWHDIMSHKVDVWSFGIIIGYCLSGISPFTPQQRYTKNVEIYSQGDLNGSTFKSTITNKKLHQDLKVVYCMCMGTTQIPKRNGKRECERNISERGEFHEIELKLANVLLGSMKSAAYMKWEKEFDGKTEVDLSWKNLTDEDALAIGEGLKTNNTLKELYLENNNITDVQSIGEGLKTNNTLTCLSLSNNNITDDSGIQSIIDGSKTNNTLQYLSLENNQLSYNMKSQLQAIQQYKNNGSNGYQQVKRMSIWA